MKAVEDSDFPIPPELKGVLRPYQKDGYRWLMTLEALGFGGILADDMGLGKSLQMLTFFKQQAREDRTSLLVCPASLVYNWQEEVEKFVPQLKVAVITGTAQVRRELLEREEHVDLLLTSYDLLKRDAPLYEGRQFYCQVLDEAQNIKNHNTQAAQIHKGPRPLCADRNTDRKQAERTVEHIRLPDAGDSGKLPFLPGKI